MLKFTSVSGSVRAITDITLTGTIIRTGITLDLIIDPITGRTTGTAGIVIIAIIIVILLTGASLIGIATPGWLEAISSQPNFFERKLAEEIPAARDRRSIFLLWRSRRFGHRAFARLIDLEFFSQLLNKCGYFLLPLRFDLLPERLFDFSAFLNVPRFKLGALLWIELKTRVANCRVCVARHRSAVAYSRVDALGCAAPGSSASKAGRCAGNFAGHLAASKASVPLRSALKVASEADLTAVHEVDLTVAREALPFAEVHEVPPSAAGDQPGRWMLLWLRLCGSARQSESGQADEEFTRLAYLPTRYFHPRRSMHPDQPRRHNPVDRF